MLLTLPMTVIVIRDFLSLERCIVLIFSLSDWNELPEHGGSLHRPTGCRDQSARTDRAAQGGETGVRRLTDSPIVMLVIRGLCLKRVVVFNKFVFVLKLFV